MQPENIVLTERGGQTVKIIDFGTAMQLRKGEKVENNYNFVFCEWQIDKKNLILYNFLLSKVQAMVGTAEFVAPEVGLSLSLSLFVTIILQNMIFHSIFHKNIVLSLIILLNIVCFFTRLLFTKYGIILIFLNNCFHFVSFFLKQIEKSTYFYKHDQCYIFANLCEVIVYSYLQRPSSQLLLKSFLEVVSLN